MSEGTLLHFADHGDVRGFLPRDGGPASVTLSEIAKVGVNLDALAADLQLSGVKSLNESWTDLVKSIETKSHAVR